MDWLQFVMHLDALDPDRVEDALLEAGACSVTLTDAGDDPVLEPGPGETPLWSSTRITGLFNGDAEPASIRSALLRSLALQELPDHQFEVLADRAWEREWLKDFGPMRFGRRLWISPAGHPVDADGAIVVELDPGLAFGTGTHPTTALCLEWLDSIDLAGKTVLDYGCRDYGHLRRRRRQHPRRAACRVCRLDHITAHQPRYACIVGRIM